MSLGGECGCGRSRGGSAGGTSRTELTGNRRELHIQTPNCTAQGAESGGALRCSDAVCKGRQQDTGGSDFVRGDIAAPPSVLAATRVSVRCGAHKARSLIHDSVRKRDAGSKNLSIGDADCSQLINRCSNVFHFSHAR